MFFKPLGSLFAATVIAPFFFFASADNVTVEITVIVGSAAEVKAPNYLQTQTFQGEKETYSLNGAKMREPFLYVNRTNVQNTASNLYLSRYVVDKAGRKYSYNMEMNLNEGLK
jgi:hypothetical protein